ncbi:MAG: hypothetical protein ACXVAX_04620 [Pseudobdellovibrio sp.]
MISFLKKVICFMLMVTQVFALEKPSWFETDNKTKAGFNFFCEGTIEDKPDKGEKAALALAESDCARKMCMLFGVEVDYKQTTKETLKDAGIETVIQESCPKVRIVGRTTKKKNIECEDGNCHAYISQFYPVEEYESEKKRLNNPPIAKDLEKTIIIREGNETFKDPKACRALMKDYSKLLGVTQDQIDQRKKILTQAKTDCAGLDYRNTELQSELMGYLVANFTKRSTSFALAANEGIMTQPNFLAKLDFLNQLENENNNDKLAEAKSILRYSYDALFYRDFAYDSSGGGGFKLPGGQIVKTHPYLAELKTCDVHADVIKKWPKNFTDDVSICLKRNGADGEDCQTTSLVMLRGAYAGCVCNLGDPGRASLCARELLTHMNTECPGEMTEKCFQDMSKKITEMMNSKIHDAEGTKK